MKVIWTHQGCTWSLTALLAMYHQRWPYAIVWHLASKMELLCAGVKKPAQFLGPESYLRFLVPCDCFYSLTFWRLSQSLWHVDAVFITSGGNNIPVFYKQLFQIRYLNSFTFVLYVQTWQWSSNLSMHANSWPGSRTQAGWQHTAHSNAMLEAPCVEGRDWTSRTCQKQQCWI